jgi:hypothetical protein
MDEKLENSLKGLNAMVKTTVENMNTFMKSLIMFILNFCHGRD